MDPKKILRSKRVLLVDDEKDVLDTLIDILDVCKLDTALSFEEGKKQLEMNDYDVVILDIMGVNGFELLKIAKERNIPAIMLTALGLSEENLQRSVKEGAVYFAPKDEMEHLGIFIADVFESIEKRKSPWIRFLERLGGFYDSKFMGADWREKELSYLIKKGGGYL